MRQRYDFFIFLKMKNFQGFEKEKQKGAYKGYIQGCICSTKPLRLLLFCRIFTAGIRVMTNN